MAEEVCADPLVVCRVYASIADMLSYMAGGVGLRAGPAANVNWRSAFALLEVSQKHLKHQRALSLLVHCREGSWCLLQRPLHRNVHIG